MSKGDYPDDTTLKATSPKPLAHSITDVKRNYATTGIFKAFLGPQWQLAFCKNQWVHCFYNNV